MATSDEVQLAFVKQLPNHEKKLLNNLCAQWHSSEFCDLSLMARDASLMVHASVLAAFSQKVASMLSEHFRERGLENTNQCVKPLAFSEIIAIQIPCGVAELAVVVSAVYTGVLNPPSSLLRKVQTVVEWLEMPELLDAMKESVDDKKGGQSEKISAASVLEPDLSQEDVQCSKRLEASVSQSSNSQSKNKTSSASTKTKSSSSILLSNTNSAKCDSGVSLLSGHKVSKAACSKSDNETPRGVSCLSDPEVSTKAASSKSDNETPRGVSRLSDPEVSTKAVRSKSYNKTPRGVSHLSGRKVSKAARSNSNSDNTTHREVLDLSDHKVSKAACSKSSNKTHRRVSNLSGPEVSEAACSSSDSKTHLNNLVTSKTDAAIDSLEKSVSNHSHFTENNPHTQLKKIRTGAKTISSGSTNLSEPKKTQQRREIKTEMPENRTGSLFSGCVNSEITLSDQSPGCGRYENQDVDPTEMVCVEVTGDSVSTVAAELTQEEGQSVQGIVTQEGPTTTAAVNGKRDLETDIKLEPEDQEGDDVSSSNAECHSTTETSATVEEFFDLAKATQDDGDSFSCPHCPRVFSLKSSLTQHIQRDHNGNSHLVCRHCGLCTETERDLRRHSLSEHGDKYLYACGEAGCNTLLDSHHHLSVHSLIHKSWTYVCERCGKAFPRAHGLRQHQSVCARSQQHLCDICGQAFNVKGSLVNHRKVMHFGQRDFVCKVCSKAFDYKANLRRHMRVHTNSFPYPCSLCSQKFRHSNTLRDHLRQKHGQDPSKLTAEKLYQQKQGKSKVHCNINMQGTSYKPRSRRQTREERMQARELGQRLALVDPSLVNSVVSKEIVEIDGSSIPADIENLFVRC